MKKIFYLLLILIVSGSCQQSAKNEKQISMAGMSMKSDTSLSKRDGIFIHISSGYENPHKALMPLKMANMMSDDKDVAIYMDIEAVKMVLKDSKDMAYADFPNLKDLLKQLIDKKVLIMACPTCLKIAGKSEKDLMAGVIPADKEKFFSFTKGNIVTIDY